MSDLHNLPLLGHDVPYRPAVRARVFQGKYSTLWYWSYAHRFGTPFQENPIRHGPFASWREAYDSARRMVELL